MRPASTTRPRKIPAGAHLGMVTLLVLGVMSVTPTLRAQAPTAAQLDSLRQRVEDAEAQLELLREQLATEAGMALRTRSRVALEFRGLVLMNAFSNSRRVNNVDVPQYARADSGTGPQGGASIAIRQTQLGLALSVADVAGGTFVGDLDVDFYGGQTPSYGGRTFPLVRLRTARAALEWTHGALMVGQEQPLISNLNPVSLAQVGNPGFTTAGNLWLWLPQLRGSLHTAGRVRFGVEAAVLAPTSGDANNLFDTQFDPAERTSTPYVQGQVRMDWGEDEQAGLIAVGVHTGRIDDPNDVRRTSRAVAMTLRLPIGSRLQVLAEAFDGQAIKGLGGGGIAQGIGVGGEPITTVGGWAQLNVRATSRLLLGVGAGMDDPDDALVLPGGRTKNTITEAHVHWRPAGPIVLGAEWRSIATEWTNGSWTNTHLNLALGFEF